MLSGFTGFHSYCILRNKTTIEHVSTRPYHVRLDYPDHHRQNSAIVIAIESSERPWDDGIRNNWNSVMGDSPWLWFCKKKIITIFFPSRFLRQDTKSSKKEEKETNHWYI